MRRRFSNLRGLRALSDRERVRRQEMQERIVGVGFGRSVNVSRRS